MINQDVELNNRCRANWHFPKQPLQVFLVVGENANNFPINGQRITEERFAELVQKGG